MTKNNAQTRLSIGIPISVLSALLIVSLIIQLFLAWQSYQRIAPVSDHMAHLEKLQSTLSTTEESLANLLPEDKSLDFSIRQRLQTSLQSILDNGTYLVASTPDKITSAQEVLARDDNPRQMLLDVLKILRIIFREEASAHTVLTSALADAAKFEVELGVATMIGLPLGAIIMLYLMRKRIFKPLQQMSYLMELLGDRQYRRVSLSLADPGLKPILENYNNLVIRLSELESQHLQYQQSLEQQVEQAARTLIEQQRNLAQTEQMAALGEITARLVHELRNPLAGIKMACINLQVKLQKGGIPQDSASRIDLVIHEIERIIGTMSSFLQQARHEPEPLADLVIDTVLQELLALARYQIPKTIRLDYQGNPALVGRLPDALFRQAVLNLILNARHAMGEQKGTITIRVECQNRHLVLSVCDEGPGFSEEFLNNGIRAFTTRRTNGTGLGLAIVQRFARNHAGTLEIFNRQALGACVKMTLDCLKPNHV